MGGTFFNYESAKYITKDLVSTPPIKQVFYDVFNTQNTQIVHIMNTINMKGEYFYEYNIRF